jgi:hypothetical protein
LRLVEDEKEEKGFTREGFRLKRRRRLFTKWARFISGLL